LLEEHWGYVSDPVRLGLFERAIRAVIKPGDLVADLGCGSGVLTMMCLRAGAAHVYAVEMTRMLDVARETLARCGLADRVTFIRGRSQKLDLPERVDVAVCDNVGWFGFDYDIVHFFADARQRFLKPGGRTIPRRVDMRVAGVESARLRRLAERWQEIEVPSEYHWVRDSCVNTKHSVELTAAELIAAPVALGGIDLAAAQPDYFSWRVTLRADRDGTFHGLAGWFESELAPGVRMTNSPLEERINRPQVFLPTGEPVAVRAGESVVATVMTRPASQLLGWTVEFPASGKRFAHSTWQGMLFSPEDLLRANPQHVPVPSEEGLARGIVLGYCDGRRTVGEIEEAVLRDHPRLFPSRDETCRFIVDVLATQTRW
jgi:protein arginine N-methyltransferase 1